MKTVTINGREVSCRYDYSAGGELCLHKAFIGEKQIFGNGKALTGDEFIALCGAIHAIENCGLGAPESGNFPSEEDSPARKIVNLTQHPATPEQVAAGVIPAPSCQQLVELLTFVVIPTYEEMCGRAAALATLAVSTNADAAMIGGAGFFMRHLEDALIAAGVKPLHAFSIRSSVESSDGKGGVIKTNVFRHVGFCGGIKW